MNLLRLIKRAAVDAVNEALPCALLFGTVTAENPPEVTVDGRLSLRGKQLVLPKGTVLAEGETVALLRAQSGGLFYILGGVR